MSDGEAGRKALASLPVWIVAGPHSGRNANWIVAQPWPGQGRWLWLTGALQRPLAAQALAAGPDRLLLDSLPGGCACCAAGAQLGVGLARALRRQQRTGEAVAGLILQLEPDGDPARLADNLRASAAQAPWQLEALVAVLADSDLRGLSAPTGRLLRCLGSADRVFVVDQAGAGPEAGPEAEAEAGAGAGAAPGVSPAAGARPAQATPAPLTRLGPDWPGRLVSVPLPGESGGRLQGGLQPGWRRFDHDPFGPEPGPGVPGLRHGPGSGWQTAARWPGATRFDRRVVADWLERLQRAASPADTVEFALIARTERDWLGWHPQGAEVPLAWRLDSRLAVRARDRAFLATPASAGRPSLADAIGALLATVPPPKL